MLPVGERAEGTAVSVPAQTEDSGVIPPPPHQILHAAATHNPKLAYTHPHTLAHTHSETSQVNYALIVSF